MTTAITAKNAPEWAAVGNKVLVRSSGYGESTYTEGVVVRHTKTQIVVKRHHKFSNEDYVSNFKESAYIGGRWQEVGTAGHSYRSSTLVAADDPQVAEAAHRAQVQAAQTQLKVALGKVSSKATVAEAEKAIQALGEFITTMHALEQKETK